MGGYKLINLHGANFTVGGDAITVAGTYDAIENSYRKRLVLTNFSIGGVEKNDREVVFGHTDDEYVGACGINDETNVLLIHVTDADAVSFAENT